MYWPKFRQCTFSLRSRCEPALLVFIIPTVFYQLGKKFGDKLVHSRALYRTQFLEFIQAQAELLLFNAEDKLKDKYG